MASKIIGTFISIAVAVIAALIVKIIIGPEGGNHRFNKFKYAFAIGIFVLVSVVVLMIEGEPSKMSGPGDKKIDPTQIHEDCPDEPCIELYQERDLGNPYD